jgi:uncharacterized membrane protein
MGANESWLVKSTISLKVFLCNRFKYARSLRIRMGWRAVLWLVVFLASSISAFAAPTYLFEVSDTGETGVTVEVTEPSEIPLPPDVSQPDIESGTFSISGKTIAVEPKGTAVVTFTSSYYTRKEEGVWHFEATVPRADVVTVILPQAVHVVQSIPRAEFSKTDRWQLSWEQVSGELEVSYVRVAEAEAARKYLTIPVPVPERSALWPWIIILAALVAGYFLYRKRQQLESPGKPEKLPANITEGQMNVIRAANPNEATVLKILLKHNGHIKRNQLEQESGLSKSSLASSLKNLEKKNIATIDRTFFVHYVALSQWFKDLK